MISTPDRVIAVELIDEAVLTGARHASASQEFGVCDRTYRRWTDTDAVKSGARPTAVRKPPLNILSIDERQTIQNVCREPEFANLPPGQIVP